MNKNLFIYLLSCIIVAPSLAQSSDQNFVMQTVFLNSGATDSVVQIQYYDGIGRPSQKAIGGINPDGKYLYIHQEYEYTGRESVTWSPVLGTAAPDFIPLDGIVRNDTYSDSKPYSTTTYDALDRPLSVSTPGEAWDGKGKSFNYRSNSAGEVKLYSSDLSTISFYPKNTLSCVVSSNEDGVVKQTFTDFLGRVVLERKGNSPNWNDTYYIYNDLGQLVYVLPPMYHINPGSQALDRYAFQYTYDHSGRIKTKKIPGCQPIYYEYDPADRVIKMKDGVMGLNQSRVFSYDKLGRLKSQSMADTTGTYIEYNEIINFYDNYDFLSQYQSLSLTYNGANILGLDYGDAYSGNASHAYSQLTGTLQKASNGELLLVSYVYDDFGRIVKQAEIGLGKNATVTEFAYNFVGDITDIWTSYYTHNRNSIILEKYIVSHIQNKYEVLHTKLPTSSVITIEDIRNNQTMTDTIQSLTYDDLGNVILNDRGGRNADMSYEYDLLHGWTTGIQSTGGFEQKLYRETGANNPRWDGSIAAMSWKTGNDYLRRYDYLYDGLHRLTSADYSYTQLGNASNNYTPLPMPVGGDYEDYSVQYGYDKNSNISSIYRQGRLRLSFRDGDGYDTIEDDIIERNGNQLKAYNPTACGDPYYGNFDFVNGSNAEVQYAYNANGALTMDLNKGIVNVEYDLLGNPRRVTLSDNRIIEYVYSADGRRLRTKHTQPIRAVIQRSAPNAGIRPGLFPTISDSTDYIANLILKNGKPSMNLFDGGYYSFNNNGVLDGCHYYIQDYQGNNRMVVNRDGTVEQVTHYYPYGELMADISTNPNTQDYKYGGKELDRTYGLDLFDFNARQLDSKFGNFTSIDPLAEKYYSISPYVYCAGDPVNLVDPTGMSIVADSLSQFALEYSLPENERHLIHFDSSGNLTIDEADSPSEVLIDIQKLVASETLYDLRVSQTDMNGKPFVEDLDYYYRGYTQTPADPDYPSQDGIVHVYMSALLSGINLILNFGHEVLAHALFYEMGIPFGHEYEYEPTSVYYEDLGKTGFEFKRIDKNECLYKQINKIQNILEYNYNK